MAKRVFYALWPLALLLGIYLQWALAAGVSAAWEQMAKEYLWVNPFARKQHFLGMLFYYMPAVLSLLYWYARPGKASLLFSMFAAWGVYGYYVRFWGLAVGITVSFIHTLHLYV